MIWSFVLFSATAAVLDPYLVAMSAYFSSVFPYYDLGTYNIHRY